MNRQGIHYVLSQSSFSSAILINLHFIYIAQFVSALKLLTVKVKVQ